MKYLYSRRKGLSFHWHCTICHMSYWYSLRSEDMSSHTCHVSPVRIFHLQHLASPRHWADGGIVRRNSPQSRPFLLSGKDTLQGLSEILTCSQLRLNIGTATPQGGNALTDNPRFTSWSLWKRRKAETAAKNGSKQQGISHSFPIGQT